MEKPMKGSVVVVPFPFSDLSNSKKRPALVVASLKGDDLILAQITSVSRMDDYSVMLLKNDFEDGGLKLDSVIRPNRLFTSDCSILFYAVGIVNKKKMEEVQNVLKNIFLF